jgi:hypothetical protein
LYFYLTSIVSISKLFLISEDSIDHVIDTNSFEYVLYAIETKEILDFIEPNVDPTTVASPVQVDKLPIEECLPSPFMPDANSWSCALCTFRNESSISRCEMCGTENPNRQIPEDDGENIIEAQDNTPSTPAGYAVWMCGQCTFMNQIDSLR